jgi:hypothetical protein
MTDDTKAGDGTTQTAGANGTGTDQKVTTNQGDQKNQTTTNTTFDPSKVSDEEFEKVFNDERLFKHSRFKDLNAQAQKAKEYEANEAKRQEEELRKKGEWEKISQQKEQEANTYKEQLKTERINNSLLAASSKLGVIDPEAVLKLVDRESISIDETTGVVSNADKAIEALIAAKPYLAGKNATTRLGSASSVGTDNTNGVKRFKHSEIKDPVFFREHEAEIMASMKAGMIEAD